MVRSPSPIAVDAEIKLFMDLKNLEENLIAIVIEIKEQKSHELVKFLSQLEIKKLPKTFQK